MEGETDETMDTIAAAAFLKISRWTLYQSTRRNEIPCHRRPGKRKILFLKKELEDFILSGKKPRSNCE
jgi:excisionase family DNA binding protein